MKFKTYLADPLIEQIKTGLEPLAFSDETYATKRDGQRPASVLMPLVPRDEGWNVMFTRRPQHMKNHVSGLAPKGPMVDRAKLRQWGLWTILSTDNCTLLRSI